MLLTSTACKRCWRRMHACAKLGLLQPCGARVSAPSNPLLVALGQLQRPYVQPLRLHLCTHRNHPTLRHHNPISRPALQAVCTTGALCENTDPAGNPNLVCFDATGANDVCPNTEKCIPDSTNNLGVDSYKSYCRVSEGLQARHATAQSGKGGALDIVSMAAADSGRMPGAAGRGATTCCC